MAAGVESPGAGIDLWRWFVLTSEQWQALAVALSMSKRESEVARFLLEGLGEDDIALRLGIARRTVHAHIERLYRRLGIHSRTDLILRIFREYIQLHQSR